MCEDLECGKMFRHRPPVFYKEIQIRTFIFVGLSSSTVIGARMSRRKWRETKEQLIWWPDLALLGSCLVSLHFQCDILGTITVHFTQVKCQICKKPTHPQHTSCLQPYNHKYICPRQRNCILNPVWAHLLLSKKASFFHGSSPITHLSELTF